MVKKKVFSKQGKPTDAVIAEIKKLKEEIASRRDRLREIHEDIEEVVDSCDRADQALEDAVDALSEYL